MRAVVYDDYGRMPSLEQVREPACPEAGVVVAVRATGVCRSDWHAWKGHDPVSLPHTPGHELAGVVASVGSGVREWAVGDRVTVPFVCGCGRCSWCLDGEAQVCPDQTQPGFTGPGSFAEKVAIHGADTNLVRLPDSVDFVTAASLGCRFATAYRALTTHGRLGAGQWLAVHGCGGVGLSAVMVGVAFGARVVAVDVNPAALERASALGASTVIDGGAVADVAAAVREVTGGGAHVSIDAFGSPELAVASVRSLRRRGRHVQAGLLLGSRSTPPIPMDLVISQELEIYGSHGMPARDYPAMLAMIADGTLRPADLVGRVIGLEDAGAALAAMDEPGTTGMTVIRLPDEQAPEQVLEEVAGQPVIAFATVADCETWFAAHHGDHRGFWLKIGKVGRAETVGYAEALEIALCHGWIDGQKRGYDETYWLQRFTPRGPRSTWSQVNRDKAEALTRSGRMRPAGQAQVDAATADGRWAAAYAGQKSATVPDDLATALAADPQAQTFFDTLTSANRYAILYRVQDAKKPSTRAARIGRFVEMCHNGETIH